MNLQVLGANRTRVNMEGNTVFFSYSTAVAVVTKDGKRYRTEKKWSRTTEKHLTEFGLKSADTKPQAWFDDEGWTKPDAETLQLTRINSDSNGNPRYVCHQCRQTIDLPEIPGGCGASGYGLTGQRPALQMICYPCCTANDKASMLDRSGPFTAYLSSDGMRVTNWTGATLGDVIRESKSRNGFHGSTIHYVRCRDVHGALWSGRGPGRGMYLTLRPMKGD